MAAKYTPSVALASNSPKFDAAGVERGLVIPSRLSAPAPQKHEPMIRVLERNLFNTRRHAAIHARAICSRDSSPHAQSREFEQGRCQRDRRSAANRPSRSQRGQPRIPADNGLFRADRQSGQTRAGTPPITPVSGQAPLVARETRHSRRDPALHQDGGPPDSSNLSIPGLRQPPDSVHRRVSFDPCAIRCYLRQKQSLAYKLRQCRGIASHLLLHMS